MECLLQVCYWKLLQFAEGSWNCTQKFSASCAAELKICICAHSFWSWVWSRTWECFFLLIISINGMTRRKEKRDLIIKWFCCRNVIMEDYGNGVECYQKALRVDARDYKSWYGLGMIYLRQEKFEFAEHHFRQAYHINPSSSVIMYYLGTTLEALKVWPLLCYHLYT